MAQYLKDIIGMVPDGILTATINSIGSIEQNKNGKDFRKVTFLFPSTGKTHTEGVFEFNFKDRGGMNGAKVGDSVEMKLDNGWPVFKILSRDGSGQSQNNTQMVRSERVATQAVTANDSAKETKDIQICLQGFMQSYITGFLGSLQPNEGLKVDGFISEAITFATKAREALLKRSAEIKSGIPSTPVHSAEQLAAVNAAFGTDSSVPLEYQ